MESSVIALLCSSDLSMGTAVTELGNLNAMGVIRSQHVKGQVVSLSFQRQGGVVTVIERATVRIADSCRPVVLAR